MTVYDIRKRLCHQYFFDLVGYLVQLFLGFVLILNNAVL